MTKYVLTEEQAKAIEEAKEGRTPFGFIERLERLADSGKDVPIEIYRALRNKYFPNSYIEKMNLIHALYTGNYEVEKPNFEVGQYMTRIRSNVMEKGEEYQEGHTFIVDSIPFAKQVISTTGGLHHIESIRPATAEEIFWCKLGRKFREVKDGDVAMDTHHTYWTDVHDIKETFDEEGIKHYYPVESRLDFPS